MRRRPVGEGLLALLFVAGVAAVASLVLLVRPALGDDVRPADEAKRLLAEGRAEEAIESARTALRTLAEASAPDATAAGAVADVEAVLARALVAVGEGEEALAHFESALRVRERAEDRIAYAEALLAIARQNLQGPNPTSLSVTPYLSDAIASAAKVEDPALLGRREGVIAESLMWRGDDAGAVEHWKAAGLENLAPQVARDAFSRMAHSLYRLGRYPEAADAWHRAGDRLGEASAWAAARDSARAMALYVALVREQPEDASLLEHALAAARFTNARPLLAEALGTLEVEGPARARVLRTRGLLVEESGDAKVAGELFLEATRADPAWALPWIDLGRIRFTAGGPQPSDEARSAALDAWLEGLRRAPEDDRVKRLLWDQAGADYLEGTRAGGSEASLERSLRAQRALAQAYPEDAEAWANLGNSLRVAGQAEESLTAYRRALEANPDSASIQSDLGLALAGAGRAAEALEAFERAVALDPTFTSARQNAARFRWLSGDDDAAEEHLSQALRAARGEGKGEMLFRFLLDRTWRTRRRPDLR